MSGTIIILMVLVGQLRSKTAILTATLLALSAGQPTVRGYEFCADTAHGMVTAIAIADYCPMRFEYTTIQFQHLSPPTSLSNGLTSWYDDCASAPLARRCTCFDRARSSLRRYFFTMKMKPLIAEEITICAIKKIFLIPAPVSMIQIDSTSCNVTYVFDRKFTVISNGYDFCCVFKIVGKEYFWRSPGCTKRRLVSCVTRASSHVAARYNAAVACTATNVYIRLGLAKRIAQDKLNAEVTVVSTLATVQTAQIHWRSILGIAPVILLMVIIIVIYGVFRFRYMFHLYADFVRYPQCANWWLCGGSTVTLMDGHVRIILHSPAGRALLPASIHWDGVKFYADAVVNTADEGQRIAFTPRRLALHLTKCGDALKIVGTSLDNIAIPAMGESITSVVATTPMDAEEESSPLYPPLTDVVQVRTNIAQNSASTIM